MNPSKTRSLPPLSQATPNDLNEALEHWEELDEDSLARLASHPESATKLAALRRIEEWMEAGGLLKASAGGPFDQAQDPSPCPPAEELFDFARTAASNEGIESHLEHCAECAGLIASLAGRPPSPLILGTSDESTPDEFAPEIPRVGLRPLGPRPSWPPLLAAAGLAGLVLIPALRGLSIWTPAETFPSHALLRGGEQQRMLFPRGKLLAAPKGAEIAYELPRAAQADSYRIEIYAHGPGAFERGASLASVGGATAQLAGPQLSAGLYSWRAFATVRGLETELGSAEFEVIEQPELCKELERVLNSKDSKAKLQLIKRLEQQGLQSDARRLARSLPESAARDEYLRGPGR